MSVGLRVRALEKEYTGSYHPPLKNSSHSLSMKLTPDSLYRSHYYFSSSNNSKDIEENNEFYTKIINDKFNNIKI